MEIAARVALALLVTTVALAPRRAEAYTLKTTSDGAVVRWRLRAVPLRIDPEVERRYGDEVREALAMAVEAWRGYENVPDIVVVRGEPGAAGYAGEPQGLSNGVYVLDDWPHDPTQLAVTVTTFEESTGRLLDADIFINGEKSLALVDSVDGERPRGRDGRRYDLGAVLTHEIGHVLGLGESDDDELATMWPRIGLGETHQRSIEEDDERGVIAAYADGNAVSPVLGCGATLGGAEPAGGERETAGLGVFAGLVAMAHARRARRRRTRERRDAT